MDEVKILLTLLRLKPYTKHLFHERSKLHWRTPFSDGKAGIDTIFIISIHLWVPSHCHIVIYVYTDDIPNFNALSHFYMPEFRSFLSSTMEYRASGVLYMDDNEHFASIKFAIQNDALCSPYCIEAN